MTNKKIKGNNVYSNLRARIYYDCGERNICGAWLALLSMGVSKKKVLEIDDDYYENTVSNFRQDCDDGVIEAFIERFMRDVKLTEEDIKPALEKHHKAIASAFPTTESYALAMQALRTDLCMLMYQLYAYLGFGKTRLKRVIDFIADYKGNEKADVYRELKIRYPDPDTLPDTTSMLELRKLTAKRQRQINEETGISLSKIS